MRSRHRTGSRLAFALLASAVLSASAWADGPTIGDCPVFPSDNVWNTPIDALPVDARSDDYIASIGADAPLKPDFGSGEYEGAPIGVPYIVVPMNQPKVEIRFAPFEGEEPAPDESDPGPYPIPRDAAIEGGPRSKDDRHVVVVQPGELHAVRTLQGRPERRWKLECSVERALRSRRT